MQEHTPFVQIAFVPHRDTLHSSMTSATVSKTWVSLNKIVLEVLFRDYQVLVQKFVPGGLGAQDVKASPVKPSGQVQIGVCCDTEHKALIPQEPRHGSRHFCWMHACEEGHSEFRVHSGLQFVGLPI